MFISKIQISNFRLFDAESCFTLDELNVPDGKIEGSGINVFVGENGCGKTSILEGLSLPILEYKGESFSLDDMNDPQKPVSIQIFSNEGFDVQGTMPKTTFKAIGFEFRAGIRSRGKKSYLSTILVTDQLFIRENPNKPKDGSPDLRLSVNNPFSGKRFSDNDILFLDKSRLYQIRSGSLNTTRFDRLMEDFNYQYIRKCDAVPDISSIVSNEVKKDKVANEFLADAVKEFQQLTGLQIKLDLIDNYQPFKNACFVFEKANNQQVKLMNLGSGFEMIFSLVYSYFLSQQSGKQLIVLIDEPELHMHPALQEQLVSFILKISVTAQVFISTHSPLLIKQLASNNTVKILILKNGCRLASMEERKLPYDSSNEINYIAFNLVTQEYHNELYEELKYKFGENIGYKEFDNKFFVQRHKEPPSYPWKELKNQVSLHTYLRNQIHHPQENGTLDKDELRISIERLRLFLSDGFYPSDL